MNESDLMNFECSWPIRKRSTENAPASWYFFSIPKEISEKIKIIAKLIPKKWRWSVKISARIGRLDRETSLFPDNKSWCYLLPIKAEVRKKLELKEGDIISLFLDLV